MGAGVVVGGGSEIAIGACNGRRKNDLCVRGVRGSTGCRRIDILGFDSVGSIRK
jgi:hypothetical protein